MGPDDEDFIKRMRALGATRVKVPSGVEVEWMTPPERQVVPVVAAPAESAEDRDARLKKLTYAHTEG